MLSRIHCGAKVCSQGYLKEMSVIKMYIKMHGAQCPSLWLIYLRATFQRASLMK